MKKLFHSGTRDKIFYKYFFSYLLIGILPILISLFAYINYGRMAIADIRTSQSTALSRLKSGFDGNLESVVKTGNLLAENDELKELINLHGFSGSDSLKAAELKNEINTVKSSMSFCSDIFIYFYQSDSIITSAKRYPSEISYIYAKSFNLTKDEMLGAIDTPDYNGYQIIQDQDGGSAILFLRNVYSYNYKDKLATIVTVVPWANLEAANVPTTEGTLFLINKSNQILGGSTAAITGGDISYTDYSEENRVIEKRIGNVNYVNSYMPSGYFDFKYCIIAPKSYYMKESNRLVAGIILQIAAMVALAFILAWYYSQKNYKPIYKLFSILRENKEAAREINFDNMEKDIENLCVENKNLSTSWGKARDALFNQMLTGQIKGWNHDEAVLEDAITAGTSLRLDKPYIALAVAYADVTDCKLFKGITESEKDNTFRLLDFVIKNILEEGLLSKYSGFLSKIDGMYLCVLNTTEEALSNGSFSFDIRKCLTIYRRLLDLKVNIGASKPQAGCGALSRAYKEAAQVLSFQTFWGKDHEAFAFYEETGGDYDTACRYDDRLMENQKKLHNMLVSKEYEQAAEFLNQILDEMFIKDIRCMDINKCRMFALINTVYSCLGDIVGRSDGEFFKKLNPMERMLKADTVEAAKRVMNEIFREITEHLQECLTNDYPGWVREIIEFVENNYTDRNLNVSVMADKLNMNLSYIGRTFKSYTGVGISDMIHMRRIEECKRRLLIGESVRETAQAVGYLDSKSLIRIFKRYEGITPGQFKINFEEQIAALA